MVDVVEDVVVVDVLDVIFIGEYFVVVVVATSLGSTTIVVVVAAVVVVVYFVVELLVSTFVIANGGGVNDDIVEYILSVVESISEVLDAVVVVVAVATPSG